LIQLKSLNLSKLKQLALDRLDVFADKILSRSFQDFHSMWTSCQIQNERSLILGQRGFGKSSACNTAYVLWRLANNPNLRVLIVSNTAAQAESFLFEIKQHIETNETLQEVFPELSKGDQWSMNEVTLANKTTVSKEASITACGAMGPIVSRHFDLILCDDIVCEENARTETQRKKLETWFFQTLMPTLEPTGQITILGTRYNANDLYDHLIRGGFAKFYIISGAIKEDGTSLWEEKFSIEKLKQMKQDYGSANFAMQFMNDPTLSEGAIFKESWIQYYDEAPTGLRVWQGVDLAISLKQTADYFAIVTIGNDDKGNWYILDWYRGRHTFLQQQDIIIQKYHLFSPITVTIESNAYQKSQIHALKDRDPNMRVTPTNTLTDKGTRAAKVSPYFEQGRVFFKRGMTDLIDELLQFPYGKHDDLFDALEIAMTRSLMGVRKKRAREPGLMSYGDGGGLKPHKDLVRLLSRI
jgi:predicted phage terminase large subunit-like protein